VTLDRGKTVGFSTQSRSARRLVIGILVLLCLVGLPERAQGTGAARPAVSGSGWIAQASGTMNYVADISCPSTSTCFAVGESGTILATSSAGKKWAAQTSGHKGWLNGVSCPTTTTCIVVGPGGTILATTNGGKTWIPRSSGTENAVEDVSCPNVAVCVGVGDAGIIVATTDGGKSWTQQVSVVSYPLIGVSCPSTTTCFAVAQSGAILVTTNEGSATPTWNLQTSGTLRFLSQISCPNVRTCFAVGDQGTILATADGGKKWTPQTWDITKCVAKSSHGNTCVIIGISCPSPFICTAVTAELGTFLVTTNGGKTWIQQSSPKLPPDLVNPGFALLSRIDCPNSSICFAVGDRGTILRWRK
jgi:photosystem II stability/assembly factor-like uncharacterized protein